ncbi:MAG: YciI family protein [Phenylobacterium sp.]|uniref:YciI family protein n=1 Tax=Phenylobacterium sp. TaxID=1871053 RepID=UPI001A374062|nr:YciI family protein [Phenylobacterium sp.]MBL8771452.1 YciI family protein [Phenylobacterium sp.]
MLYALLAYHEEHVVQAMDEAADNALMANLEAVHGRWTAAGTLGPAARLGATTRAATVRGQGRGFVTDGPFAETKEALLGFYVVEAESLAAAVELARDLKAANPSAAYEVRPIVLFRPGAPFPLTDAGLGDVRP